MKRTSFKIFFAALVVVLAGFGCKKNNLVIDKDPITPPPFAEFALSGNAATSATMSYFIEDNPSSNIAIPIGITNVSNVDRTIQLTYTSRSAVQGVQYNAPASITIPAGKALDSLRINGLFAGYPGARIDTVKIKITGGDVPANVFRDSVSVIMQKYCPVDLTALAGDYTKTREFTSAGTLSWPTTGPGYTTSLYNIVSTGPTTATASIAGLYDDDWKDINLTLDWTDKANFIVTIPQQSTGSAGSAKFVRTSTGGGSTFSSCERRLSIVVDILTASGAVATSKYRFDIR